MDLIKFINIELKSLVLEKFDLDEEIKSALYRDYFLKRLWVYAFSTIFVAFALGFQKIATNHQENAFRVFYLSLIIPYLLVIVSFGVMYFKKEALKKVVERSFFNREMADLQRAIDQCVSIKNRQLLHLFYLFFLTVGFSVKFGVDIREHGGVSFSNFDTIVALIGLLLPGLYLNSLKRNIAKELVVVLEEYKPLKNRIINCERGIIADLASLTSVHFTKDYLRDVLYLSTEDYKGFLAEIDKSRALAQGCKFPELVAKKILRNLLFERGTSLNQLEIENLHPEDLEAFQQEAMAKGFLVSPVPF